MNHSHLSETPCWYAIYTHLRQENRADLNLQTLGIETLSPKIRQPSYKVCGERTFIVKHLFPRYLFARFQIGSSLLSKVCFTRGVHSLVRCGPQPAPIDDEIISRIKSRISEDGFVKLVEGFKPGDRVFIKDGPFKNFMGIFEREMKASERVRVLLTSISYQGHIVVEKQELKRASKGC
jgi:transcriptional antiterminator RfaH